MSNYIQKSQTESHHLPSDMAAQDQIIPTANCGGKGRGKEEKQQAQKNHLALVQVTPGLRKQISNDQGLLPG